MIREKTLEVSPVTLMPRENAFRSIGIETSFRPAICPSENVWFSCTRIEGRWFLHADRYACNASFMHSDEFRIRTERSCSGSHSITPEETVCIRYSVFCQNLFTFESSHIQGWGEERTPIMGIGNVDPFGFLKLRRARTAYWRHPAVAPKWVG